MSPARHHRKPEPPSAHKAAGKIPSGFGVVQIFNLLYRRFSTCWVRDRYALLANLAAVGELSRVVRPIIERPREGPLARGRVFLFQWTATRLLSAFTLIELMVVISIIALLAAAGVPAIRGMTKSNALIASNRQFQQDLAYARQVAIAEHTSVFVVFVPPGLATYTPPATVDNATLTQFTNLLGGQYTTYALVSMRLTGEQPGRSTPHYLTQWRNLPSGVFFAAAKFGPPPVGLPALPPQAQPFTTAVNVFPFPNSTNYPGPTLALPYVGFDYQGRLINADGSLRGDEYIPFARGSIFYARGPNGGFVAGAASVQESPPGNSANTLALDEVYINALTGRNKLLTAAIP